MAKLLSDEAFQKLLFDLFCVWHDVQRHYDPPITHTEDEKMAKVKQMICKLLGEIDGRVKRLQSMVSTTHEQEQMFIEEWSMLTWNVLCITSRLQNEFNASVKSQEDRVIYNKLNMALVDLVNNSRAALSPQSVHVDATFDMLASSLSETMHILHGLYRTLKSNRHMALEEVQQFAQRLQLFSDENLIPFVEMFKSYCNEQTVRLWQDLRDVQIACLVNKCLLPVEPVVRLVTFYSFQMHRLAILAARLQGFRYELTVNNRQMFGDYDPVSPLSDSVFSALELLMAGCGFQLLATEPSLNPILVTNNLFSVNCGALARGVVFKQFDVQIVSEETAEHIQSEMRKQRLLQQPSPIAQVPAAALLAMKPTSGTKRTNAQTMTDASGNTATAHKKSDINSKEVATIYPVFNSKNHYWAASYPHLLCTTRQKGRHSTSNSYQDLSPIGIDSKTSTGKRPVFYFYIRATMFSPSGRFADAHTLSLPFTIATRRNQDYQVQRMMSSYTATCFWLYGNNVQDGLLLQWVETAMGWEKFKFLFMQHFRVSAEVERGLQEKDFDLLQYKIQCNDCSPPALQMLYGERKITFKNILCPHLRYECGSTNVRFSVWRGLLEVLQLFQDSKTRVRKLWEKNLLMGFMEFDQVSSILEQYASALVMRLSFVTGGTICITLKSTVHSVEQAAPTAPMHLEPLDLKKLQAKSLVEYLRDIAIAEKIKYLINSNNEPIAISELLEHVNEKSGGGIEELETSRCISSNVTHTGDIDAMQQITFTAMRIAVVTCKVKPPSADNMDFDEVAAALKPKGQSPVPSMSNGFPSPLNPTFFGPNAMGAGSSFRLPATPNDDFVREIIQLCNFWGKSKQDLTELLEQAAEDQFSALTIHSGPSLRTQSMYRELITGGMGVSNNSNNNNTNNTMSTSAFANGVDGNLLQQQYVQQATNAAPPGMDLPVLQQQNHALLAAGILPPHSLTNGHLHIKEASGATTGTTTTAAVSFPPLKMMMNNASMNSNERR